MYGIVCIMIRKSCLSVCGHSFVPCKLERASCNSLPHHIYSFLRQNNSLFYKYNMHYYKI